MQHALYGSSPLMTVYDEVAAPAGPTWMNRKQRRAFLTLFRRRKLRRMAPLVPPHVLAFLRIQFPKEF